jgi:hypothetical protein
MTETSNTDGSSNVFFVPNPEELHKALVADGNYPTQRDYLIHLTLEQMKAASGINNIDLLQALELQFKALVY